ncbi:MAG: YeeE/YedE thiosulfate transporter family protein [bacterium]
MKTSPTKSSARWSWRSTGLWVGLIGVIAWIASFQSGCFFGMAILPGSKDALEIVISAKGGVLNWDLFFVLGIPLGSFISAARSGSFSWSSLSGPAIWKLAGGGFLLARNEAGLAHEDFLNLVILVVQVRLLRLLLLCC